MLHVPLTANLIMNSLEHLGFCYHGGFGAIWFLEYFHLNYSSDTAPVDFAFQNPESRAGWGENLPAEKSLLHM